MRYFAEIFDADGKAYIFDDAKGGAEVCGPFDTLENAEQAANDLNTDADLPDGLRPRELQEALDRQ